MDNKKLILEALKTRHRLDDVLINAGYLIGLYHGPKGARRMARLKCGKMTDYSVVNENGNLAVKYRGHLVQTIGPA